MAAGTMSRAAGLVVYRVLQGGRPEFLLLQASNLQVTAGEGRSER